MIRRIAFLTWFLVPALLANAQQAEKVGMAVAVRNYLQVRRSAGAFLSQLIPDYYEDLPDSWLAPALNSGGMKSIDHRGDLFFLAVEKPEKTAWAALAPVISASFYLDALRANLGRETQQEGAYVFAAQQPPDGTQHRGSLYVRMVGRTAVVSADDRACRLAASMLEKKQIAKLFDGNRGAPVRIAMTHAFIKRHRDGLFQTLYHVKLMAAATLGSLDADAFAGFYANRTLDVIEQAENLYIDISPAKDLLAVCITIRPRPKTALAEFLAAQEPMKRNLLEKIPGDPVFACAGKVKSIGSLGAAYAESVRKLWARLPAKAKFAQAASNHAAERLKRFDGVFDGHFAAALVQSPRDSFGVEYVRAYEVSDAAKARANLAWEITGRSELGETVKALPEEEYAGRTILAYELAAPTAGPQPRRAIRAALVENVMLLASGAQSRTNIGNTIDACAGEASEAITNAKHFLAATTEPPDGASAVAVFSITGFLQWAGSSGLPLTENLRTIQPVSGIAVWFVPKDETLSIHLRVPAGEITELRKALFGNIPILGLPM